MKKRIISVLLIVCLMVSTMITGIITAEATQPYYTSLAKEIADEGMVLLENDGTLPIARGTNVALFGKGYIDYFPAGGGSGLLSSGDVVTPTMAFATAVKDKRINLYQPLDEFYHTSDITVEPTVSAELMSGAAAFTDTAVLFISRFSEEGYDRTAVKGDGDYYLSAQEETLIKSLSSNFKKVIIVLNITGVMDTSWFKGENAIIDPAAVLVAWLPGIQGANSIVDIITGRVNPSGKLVDTFAKAYTDYPSSETFAELNTQYIEDIYVGYRYFDTIPGAAQKVNYWFGYGLSYTTFSQTNHTLKYDDKTITATVKVTNTGSVAGKDVVALYFGHPTDTKLDYANKELCAYQKTGLLEPGESETVTLTFDIADMAGYDADGLVQKSAYVLEKGAYSIYSGNDVSKVTKIGEYALAETIVTEQLTSLCVPTQLSKILKADGTYKVFETASGTAAMNPITATGTSEVSAVAFNTIENPGALSYIEKDYIERFNQSLDAKIYYDINVDADGTYAMYASIASKGVNANDIWDFYIDGVKQESLVLSVTSTSAAGYYVWRHFNAGEVALTKGKHTFMIHVNTSAGVNFRGLSFVPQGETLDYNKSVATVAPQKTTILKATSFVDMIPAGSVNYNANTQGYMERYNTNYNSTLWYVIEAEEDCTLGLYVNRGQNGAGSIAQYNFTVGSENYTITHEQPNTYAWNTFKTAKCTGTVSFKKGKNILGITPITNCTSNIQTFVFLPVDREYASDLGTSGPNNIKFPDVVKDESLLDAFVAQFTASEIGDLVRGSEYFASGSIANYEIPRYWMANGPTGLREGNQKSFLPCGILVACTFNDILAYKFGVACGLDGRDTGIKIWLAPGTNIHRDPLCGRNFEYFSEDPFISGKMSAAQVNGAQYCGMAVTLKHFVGNERENSRTTSNSIIGERALREIYLEPFKIAVEESNPWAFMSSYNLLNGIETASNKDLITGILRGEWNYDGILFTDWNNNDSDQVKELLAGNDVKMPATSGSTANVVAAYEAGTLSRQLLEDTAKRIIRFYCKIENRFYTELDNENLGLLESGYVPASWSKDYLNKSIQPIKFVKTTESSGFHNGVSLFSTSGESVSVAGSPSSKGWDTSNYKEGYASYGVTVGTSTIGLSKSVSVNALQDDECYFWIWIDNPDEVRELVWEVSSSGSYSGAAVRYRINPTYGKKLQQGWNKIDFVLHDSTNLSTNASDAVSTGFSEDYVYYLGGGMTGNVNWSNLNYFRVFTSAKTSSFSMKVNALNFCINRLNEVPESEYKTYEIEKNEQNMLISNAWVRRFNKNLSGRYAYHTTTGGKIQFSFEGTHFRLVSYKSPSQGNIYLSVDDGEEFLAAELKADVADTYFKEVVYKSKALDFGKHTVTIRVEGKAYIDALMIAGTLVECTDPIKDDVKIEVENILDAKYTGSWSKKYAWKHSGHSAMYTSNGSVEFDFEGDELSVLSYLANTQGAIYISVDDGEAVMVDLYDDSTDTLYAQTVYTQKLDTYGKHTVKISAEGKAYVDAIIIRRNSAETVTYEGEDGQITLNGNWSKKYSWSHSNHNAMYTSTGGSVEFSYTGYDFKVLSYKAKTQGKMYVSVDGSAPYEVDLYDDSSDTLFKSVAFDGAGMDYGTHTVTITTSGKVYFDAVKIDGILN